MLENLSYEEYRKIAKDGDIVFLHGTQKSLVSSAIMILTGHKYSHCFISFWVDICGQPRLLCVENQGGSKRRLLSASYYGDRTFDIIRAPVPWSELSELALSRVGEAKYGYIDAIFVGLKEYFWRKFAIRLSSANSRGEICSEFIARLLQFEQPMMSPGTLYEQLKLLYPKN